MTPFAAPSIKKKKKGKSDSYGDEEEEELDEEEEEEDLAASGMIKVGNCAFYFNICRITVNVYTCEFSM